MQQTCNDVKRIFLITIEIGIEIEKRTTIQNSIPISIAISIESPEGQHLYGNGIAV
jgi:hypothetical protein